MKRFTFLFLLVGAVGFAETQATHTEDLSVPQRTQVDPQQQYNRLQELISACSNGRPGAGGQNFGAVGAPAPTVTIPGQFQLPPNDIPPVNDTLDLKNPDTTTTSGDVARGGQLYQDRCIRCHQTNPKAPNLAAQGKAIKIADVMTDRMPFDGPMNAQDKADILAFFNTLSE